jgi:probable rRNA maturation factor
MDSETHSIEVTIEAPAWRAAVTEPELFCTSVVEAVLRELAAAPSLAPVAGSNRRPLIGSDVELGIVLTDDARIRALNARWRGFDKPTNVLSFPSDLDPAGLPAGAPWLLGDVVVALETVQREAAEAGRPVGAHLTHLLVHGILHLLGYDHEIDAKAVRMEALEIELLARLNIANPYAETLS